MNALSAIQQRLASRSLATNALAGLGGDQPARLSIKDNRFTLIDAAGNEKMVGVMDQALGLYLDVNFIDINEAVSKQYRPTEEAFDPTNPTPPTCFSDDGIKPDDASTTKQATACVSCPKNERGSAVSKISGAKIKACRDLKKTAIIVPSAAGDIVFQFVVTPGSMDTWRQYLKTLAGHGVDLILVTTRMFFAGQGVLGFQPVAMIDETIASTVEKLLDAKASDFAVGRSSKPALPGPAAVQEIAHAAVEAAVLPPKVDERNPPPEAFGVTSQPARRGRPRQTPAPEQPAVRANETFVPPGPISQQTPFPAQQAAQNPFHQPGAQQAAQQANLGQPQARHTPGNGAAFGVQPNPLPPTADMQAALDNVFKLPT